MFSTQTPPALDSALQPIDWDRISRWTASILAADLAPIAAIFLQHGAPAPVLVWSPTPDDPQSEPPRHLLAHWSSLATGDRLPAIHQIDPLDLRPALGYVIIIDVVADGQDFRYRLFGSAVSSVSGFDMTGRLVSEHPASTYVTEFSIAVGRAAIRRRAAVYTARRPVGAQDTLLWERLVLPLVDENGRVARLLIAATPIGKDGKLIRAVY